MHKLFHFKKPVNQFDTFQVGVPLPQEICFSTQTLHLEFLNDTWTGQDLRKVQILLYAYEITNDRAMLAKANLLLDYFKPKLIHSKELKYTHEQALIMQNLVTQESPNGYFTGRKKDALSLSNLKPIKTNTSFALRVVQFIRQYSISKEITLLCISIDSLTKAFK